jgi:hypothetical protein
MSDRPRWFRWHDPDDYPPFDLDDVPHKPIDLEWSADQTFVGEFGHTNQFGDPID